MLVESIQAASDLLLSTLKPFIWGQLFGDGTSIVHHLLGIITQLRKCDNTGMDGLGGDYRGCEGSSRYDAANDCQQRRGGKKYGKRFCPAP